jgi:hypothetical protein
VLLKDICFGFTTRQHNLGHMASIQESSFWLTLGVTNLKQ